MNELKLGDLQQMLSVSGGIGVETGVFDKSDDVEVIIQDEEGYEYDIQDVKFDKSSGVIAIRFSHDNDPED